MINFFVLFFWPTALSLQKDNKFDSREYQGQEVLRVRAFGSSFFTLAINIRLFPFFFIVGSWFQLVFKLFSITNMEIAGICALIMCHQVLAWNQNEHWWDKGWNPYLLLRLGNQLQHWTSSNNPATSSNFCWVWSAKSLIIFFLGQPYILSPEKT